MCLLNGHIWHPSPSQLCLISDLEGTSYFKHIVQSSFWYLFLGPPNHIPLKYMCLIQMSNQIRHVDLELGIRTVAVELAQELYR